MRSASKYLGVLLVLGLLAGCATEGARRTAATPATPSRPTVRLEIDPGSHAAFRPRVEKQLNTNELRASLVLDRVSALPVDYTIRLKFGFREVPLTDAEGIWAMADALLLTLYPASCNRYLFSLDASVADASGDRIRTYSLTDLDTAWVWLLIGPKCESPEGLTGDGVGDAAEQLLIALYRRMARDDILDPTRLSELKQSHGPLVYVTGPMEEDVLQEGFLLDESPVRFTFDGADAAVADYTLQLSLSFSGRDFSMGRAMLAIMTAGVTGVCPTRTATLDGTAVDRHGRQVSHYRSDARWRPSMAENCAAARGSGPEMIRKLARAVARQVTPASLAWGRAVQAGPVVRIVSNAARTAVERTASEQAFFANLTLEPEERVHADYVLDLTFSASGGGSKIGPEASTAQQVAAVTLFMFGSDLCKRIEHLLRAEFKDVVTGRVLASRQVSKLASSEDVGCSPSIEPPDRVARSMVSSVFESLARDPAVEACRLGRKPGASRREGD